MSWGPSQGNPLLLSIITTRNNIPFVLIDRDQRVIASHLIPEHILNHPDLLNQKLVELPKSPRIKVETLYNETFYIFFDESKLLKSLTYFPYIQLLVIIVFVLFGYIALRSTKQENRIGCGSVWPKRRLISWGRRPLRCWDGSSTCGRRISILRPLPR